MNILVLGDGLLGTEIVKQTGWDFISRKQNGFDLNHPETYPTQLLTKKWDTILNCIAHTDTYSSEREPHWNTNYKAVTDLVDFCNEHKLKLIHISTDYVYTHSTHPASEENVPVHCNNWYGYTKLLGDAHVQLKSKNYLLIRTTHKPKPFPFPKAWENQIGNFDYVDRIASLIIQSVKNNASGVLNVGTEIKTMLELAKQTNPSVQAISKPESAPANVSMTLNKLNHLLSK